MTISSSIKVAEPSTGLSSILTRTPLQTFPRILNLVFGESFGGEGGI